MSRNSPRRGIISGVFVAALAFGSFWRTTGAESVRAVQILSLVGAGMGLGVALVHFKMMLAGKKNP